MWGTKEYFAPEVVDMAYGPQADVWALGCVLYEMLSGEQVRCFLKHIVVYLVYVMLCIDVFALD